MKIALHSINSDFPILTVSDYLARLCNTSVTANRHRTGDHLLIQVHGSEISVERDGSSSRFLQEDWADHYLSYDAFVNSLCRSVL